MNNPAILIFLLGFVLGVVAGMYVGNHHFKEAAKRIIRGDSDYDDEDDD